MTLHRVINLIREVPDLATTRGFFTEFGLETSSGIPAEWVCSFVPTATSMARQPLPSS